jgi:ABC-type multidrug transport system fused ATPase/permease subunit
MFQFIHLVPTIPMKGGGRKIPHHSFAGEIRFDKVDFAYPTRPNHVIFNQLDLHIPAGHVVALCGASGQGFLGFQHILAYNNTIG